MHPIVLVGLLICIGGLLYRQFKVYSERRKLQFYHLCRPAPRLLQMETILGLSAMLENLKAWKARKFLELARKRYNIAGLTYSATVAGNRTIFTIEPENIKAVFADHFDDFDVGWLRLRGFGPAFGEILFTSDGARWRHQRAMMRPAINRRQILDFQFFKSDINVLIDRIPKDGSTIDMAPLFYTHALTLASRLLFGEPIASLNPDFKFASQRFIDAVRDTNRGIERRFRMGRLLPLIPRDNEFEKAKDILHEYADFFVRKALKHRASGEGKREESNGDLGNRYLFLGELAKESDDPVYLRNNLLGMLLGGSDTTANLMTGCLSLLSQRAGLWAGLRSEVLELGDWQPDYDGVKGLRSLTYLINEVLRLYPIIPRYARLANKDTSIPCGGGPDGKSMVFVPKGTLIEVNTYALHRREDIYGSDANEFKPERWASFEPMSWAYLPFSAGPRVCIGQQYALMEVSYTLVRLLQEFSSIESRDPEPWSEQLGVTFSNANGAKMTLTPADCPLSD